MTVAFIFTTPNNINLNVTVEPTRDGDDFEFISIKLDDSDIDIQELILIDTKLANRIESYLWNTVLHH